MPNHNGPGRPKKEPTKVIRIPCDRVPDIEKLLGRSIAENQTPFVNVRVPEKDVKRIRKELKK